MPSQPELFPEFLTRIPSHFETGPIHVIPNSESRHIVQERLLTLTTLTLSLPSSWPLRWGVFPFHVHASSIIRVIRCLTGSCAVETSWRVFCIAVADPGGAQKPPPPPRIMTDCGGFSLSFVSYQNSSDNMKVYLNPYSFQGCVQCVQKNLLRPIFLKILVPPPHRHLSRSFRNNGCENGLRNRCNMECQDSLRSQSHRCVE